jgi:hypothetical protein
VNGLHYSYEAALRVKYKMLRYQFASNLTLSCDFHSVALCVFSVNLCVTGTMRDNYTESHRGVTENHRGLVS